MNRALKLSPNNPRVQLLAGINTFSKPAFIGGGADKALPVFAKSQELFAKAAVAIPTGPSLRLTLSLEHARARSLDDQKTYGLTGLGITGDLPGFWMFTSMRVDLGIGLQSDIAGVKGVNGLIALLRVF